jgi:hypothetical protein
MHADSSPSAARVQLFTLGYRAELLLELRIAPEPVG